MLVKSGRDVSTLLQFVRPLWHMVHMSSPVGCARISAT